MLLNRSLATRKGVLIHLERAGDESNATTSISRNVTLVFNALGVSVKKIDEFASLADILV
jgi:hypothetical protein